MRGFGFSVALEEAFSRVLTPQGVNFFSVKINALAVLALSANAADQASPAPTPLPSFSAADTAPSRQHSDVEKTQPSAALVFRLRHK